VAIVSVHLIEIGSWFQIVGAATEKACLLIFILVLGTKSSLEMVTCLRALVCGKGLHMNWWSLQVLLLTSHRLHCLSEPL